MVDYARSSSWLVPVKEFVCSGVSAVLWRTGVWSAIAFRSRVSEKSASAQHRLEDKAVVRPFFASPEKAKTSGGFDNNLPLSSVERYDPDLDRWVCVRPMSTSRGGVGVGELSGRLYAVGGHNGTRYLDSVEAYDPATDRWEPVASIHGGRAGPGVSHCSCPALLLCQLNRDENQTSFEEELPPQLS
ncbi:hypothetical protein ISCGN_027911 [Ixodes scapularis]